MHPAHKIFNSKLADITHCDWEEMRLKEMKKKKKEG